MFGNGQRTGQPRRFDAKEIDQPGDPMHGRALDDEIGNWALRPEYFRPDACITRRERTIAQPGPVFAHLGIKSLAARRVHHEIIG